MHDCSCFGDGFEKPLGGLFCFSKLDLVFKVQVKVMMNECAWIDRNLVCPKVRRAKGSKRFGSNNGSWALSRRRLFQANKAPPSSHVLSSDILEARKRNRPLLRFNSGIHFGVDLLFDAERDGNRSFSLDESF